MRNKKIDIVRDPLFDAIAEIQRQNKVKNDINGELDNRIVDIMTFCDDPRYLNLPGNNFNLFLSQKIILKTFYMGSRGNEKLTLNKEEWEWLNENSENMQRDNIVYETNLKDVIKKIQKIEKREIISFRELHLVLGRRGSKTVLASIISAYELYKLLVIGDGDPHKFYGLPYDDEIAIINVALSQEQAGRLFGQVEARIRNSPFFTGRIASSTTREIRFYTDRDLEKKQKGVNIDVRGSVFILCGHSNPDTLRGYSTILILFDELAFYDESGKVSGSYFYNTLKPSLAKFVPYGDARLVEISSPATTSGIFYDIYKDSKMNDNILSFQLPTWVSNPEIRYENLKEDRERSIDNFIVEYGAQWARSGSYGTWFPEELVDKCLNIGIMKGLAAHVRPHPRFSYFLHVDPAINRDRYAAVLVAKEIYNNHLGHRRVRVRLANVWIWDPVPGIGLVYTQIDKDVIKICSIYHPLAVTYDQFNSVASLQLLKSHGINCIQTSYNRSFKNKIYQNLREMMAYQPEPEIWLYDDPRLIGELKNLKYRPTARGVTFMVDKHGDIKTDDLADCLAGAVAMASENIRAPSPLTITVSTPWIR